VTLAKGAGVKPVEHAAAQLRSAAVDVRLGGTAFAPPVGASQGTEVIGILAALVILLLVFNYALFIVSRYRKSLLAGESVPDAIAAALATSGRAVLFAGVTVIAALLGMYVVGLSVLTGMAEAAAMTVLMTVAAATTLLAMLGTVTDTEVAGCPARAGEMVFLPLASANRDPKEFPDAGKGIIDRTANRHLAFVPAHTGAWLAPGAAGAASNTDVC
jgi:uncharacterized membrane protein YdfJ with MMPL/SSD domain